VGNAGLIRDQRYRTDPDAGLKQLNSGRNADARLTFSGHSGIPAFIYDFSTSYSKHNSISKIEKNKG
jgi:hypothetical protein